MDEAIERLNRLAVGYNPRRRSAMWTIVDSLLRQKGPYRDLYVERRRYQCSIHPEFLNGKTNKKTGEPSVVKRCDLQARRYVEKRVLRDLWRAWRDAK